MPDPPITRRAFVSRSLRSAALTLSLVLPRTALLRAPAVYPERRGDVPARGGSGTWLSVQEGPSGLVLETGRGDTTLMRADPLVLLIDGDNDNELRPTEFSGDSQQIEFSGGNLHWELRGRGQLEPELDGLVRLDLQLRYHKQAPGWMSAQVRFDLPEAGVPSWLVPGAFYQHGPAPGYTGRPYPRFHPSGGDPEQLVSNSWSFRVDRASHPAVLGWSELACLGMATDPSFGNDLAGLEFGGDGARAWLALNFPWRDLPRRYARIPGPSQFAPGVVATRAVQSGDEIGMTCWLYLSDPDPHAFDPLLRWLYARHSSSSALRPWFGKDAAASLAAGGIVRWHANPPARLLYETAWFAERPGLPRLDRKQQHVGWVSGVPTALALSRYGRAIGDTALETIGLDVIDRVAQEAPGQGGLLWADWDDARGWGTGWSPRPDWIQARTVAEATLFLLRAAEEQTALGRPRPEWEKAAGGSLEFALRAQREDGNFGAYYHVHEGGVADWSGAAGMLWIAALVAGWRTTGDSRYLDAARRGGECYALQVETNSLFGAPEDVGYTPTSEDGYNALLSYSALAGADEPRRGRWLALARLAANWTMTFRFGYNVPFRPDTNLGALEFATRGADLASPRNCHLHPYGLICLREMLDLWEVTRDQYYLSRARDNLLSFWQTIARFDGDFGAGQGMMTEQWYQTDWDAPKGGMLPLSHVWCLGMVLHGWWAVSDFGDLVLDGSSGRATLLAPGRISNVRVDSQRMQLTLTNPLRDPLPLRARLVDLTPRTARAGGVELPIDSSTGRPFISFIVPPEQELQLELESEGATEHG